LKIYTTLDSRYQRFADKAVRTHLKFLEDGGLTREKDNYELLQAALVALDNRTGAIRVLLGGRQYSESQFNRAVSNNRLPGSGFKPIVYMAAMEKLGYNPATVMVDEPSKFPIPGRGEWEPRNFNNEYAGSLVLKKALMRSLNIISAKMVYDLTPRKVIRMARQFGITSPLGDHLSLALGTSPVSPLELTAAYSVIANQGILNEPYFVQKIEDYEGNTLYEHFYHGVQRFSPKAIYPLLDMMQGVVDGGTGQVIRKMGFKFPAGGKTGTTNDYKDAWFIGFTRDISASVWVGFDDNQPMLDKNGRGLTGTRAAAPVWAHFMQNVLKDKSKVNFPVPDGILRVQVDAQTGYLPDESTQEKIWVAVKEDVDLKKPPPTETEPNVPGDKEVTTVPQENNDLPKF